MTALETEAQAIMAKLQAAGGSLTVLTDGERSRLLDLIAVREEHDEAAVSGPGRGCDWGRS